MIILENKFGPVSDSIHTRIQQIMDEVVLKSLIISASQAKTLEEFLRDLE